MSVGYAVGDAALRIADVSPQTTVGLFLRQAERLRDRTLVQAASTLGVLADAATWPDVDEAARAMRVEWTELKSACDA
jgi:hypothetical protein